MKVWTVPLHEAPPAASYPPFCSSGDAHLNPDGRLICTRPFGHGGQVHASHGKTRATLWPTT